MTKNRDWNAISAWFRPSAGPMKTKEKEDDTKEQLLEYQEDCDLEGLYEVSQPDIPEYAAPDNLNWKDHKGEKSESTESEAK